uniref:Uncharacterized protein n=1 Tax=Chromera velia CCMP2878 TaxID=1169474 RepID=A0A0G4FGN6_9ALVE|eukprot:Cvel_16918.t1-p1 / transcript=Cvel_16918.t1 / gene=Cvel_16918 / organism=Chromera_velia_CCMP2878 / gene_product=hypothetical protein / transcript_product=hypothetical protein / location=Cvel_scaffold1325:32293-32886(-) / protein_length=198 / sequence_SO=supercontig / SO=protein_coding / is_pseudo=false
MRYDPTATAVLAPALFVPGVTLPHGGTVPLDAIADGQPATHFQVLPPAKPSLRGFEHQQQQGHLRQQAEVSGAGMVGTPTPPSDLLSMATVQGIPLHQLYLRGQQLQHQRGGQEPSPSPSAAPFPPPSSSACGGQQGHQQQQPQPQQLAMSMPLSLGRERSRETETATVVAQTQPVSSSSAASQAYSPFQQQQGHYQQ